MHVRHILGVATVLCLAASTLPAQKASSRTEAPADSGSVLRTETRLVLVDAVVTDKKGNYIRDLGAKDFRVWEDKTEQTVKSLSYEANDPALGNQKRYLVFFFDVTSMTGTEQVRARQAAAKFTATNFGPNKMMAVADFDGNLKMTQNFTPEPELISKALNQIRQSTLSPVATPGQGFGGQNIGGPASDSMRNGGQNASGGSNSDFAGRNALLALKMLARSLSSFPGRKTLVLFAGGLAINSDRMTELTATINACNMANVTIYSVDARGLGRIADASPQHQDGLFAGLHRAILDPFTAALSENTGGFVNSFQARGGGGAAPGGGATGGGATGGGATGGGASGGNRGGASPAPSNPGAGFPSTGTPNTGTQPGRGTGNTFPGTTPDPNAGRGNPNDPRFPNPNQNANMAPRQLQEIANLLASGTGGTEVRNTNDLLAGLETIGKEQNEYYLIGYTPPDSTDDSCHKLRVQVNRGGTQVRARPSYCSGKPHDLLSGKPAEKILESRAAASQAGNIGASMQIPYFYTSPNMARVNVAMELPYDSLKFQKQKGKLHAAMDVLGIATLADGTVGARFSDTLKLDFDDQHEVDALKLKTLHYENQFDIASGAYTLKIVFSAGTDSFGKLETPLVVGTYETNEFSVSGIALSKESHPTNDVTLGLDALLIDDQTPLIANGKRIVPSGSNRFAKTDPAAFYFEIYEPLLAAAASRESAEVGVQIRILDRQTAQPKTDSGLIKLNTKPATESGMLPVSGTMPLSPLSAGAYLLELQAKDSAGNTVRRVTPFDVE
jgi:VWFA-related protein